MGLRKQWSPVSLQGWVCRAVHAVTPGVELPSLFSGLQLSLCPYLNRLFLPRSSTAPLVPNPDSIPGYYL